MGKTTLTKEQQTTFRLVAENKDLKHCYLSGGTALSEYYLRHRISDDLDFFSPEDFDMTFLESFAEKIAKSVKAKKSRFEKFYDRRMFFFELKKGELKVEFTKYPFRQLTTPQKRDGLQVDSLRDIAANKLMAMLDRFDPKDFVDLYFLLQKFSLKKIRKDAEKKFGTQLEPVFIGSELMKAQRIEALPKMLKKIKKEELKNFFVEVAQTLKPEVL